MKKYWIYSCIPNYYHSIEVECWEEYLGDCEMDPDNLLPEAINVIDNLEDDGVDEEDTKEIIDGYIVNADGAPRYRIEEAVDGGEPKIRSKCPIWFSVDGLLTLHERLLRETEEEQLEILAKEGVDGDPPEEFVQWERMKEYRVAVIELLRRAKENGYRWARNFELDLAEKLKASQPIAKRETVAVYTDLWRLRTTLAENKIGTTSRGIVPRY